MPQRDGFPPGVPAWLEMRSGAPQATASFYSGLFAWELEDAAGGGSSALYLVARLGGRSVAGVSSMALYAPTTPAWTTYIAVASADDAAARVQGAGGRIVVDPVDLSDLARVAVCADLEGAVFGLWQPGRIKGAQSVNAPGTWNFSELRSRDSAAARVFYGEVFGWEADDADAGGGLAGSMLRLPGYADFLEQFDPGIRQRHADFGAPPGFSDCIGWILPLEDGLAPHWSVTFAIDDADAVASRPASSAALCSSSPLTLRRCAARSSAIPRVRGSLPTHFSQVDDRPVTSVAGAHAQVPRPELRA
jgi:predicted enzyme related to lactoylglutathione lyase